MQRGEGRGGRSRTSGILVECENLHGLCTNSSSSSSSSLRRRRPRTSAALFQLEPPRPVERDLRERDPIVYIYIYIKPPFIRDNKQSCYRREINIVTFIRGQIEGANEPTFVVCIAERSIASSTDQSFFHADKAFPARPKVIADNSSSSRANETDLSPAADSSTDPSPLQRTFRGGEKILAVVLDSSPTNRDSIRFPFPKKLANASLRNSMSLARIISRRRDARVASDQYARGKCAVNTCGARGVADDCTRPPRVDRAFSLKEEPVSHSVAHTNWIVHGVWKRSVLRTQRNIVRQTREQRPCIHVTLYHRRNYYTPVESIISMER